MSALTTHGPEWRLWEIGDDDAPIALRYEVCREQAGRGWKMDGLRSALKFFPVKPWLALTKAQREKVLKRFGGTVTPFPAFTRAAGQEGIYPPSLCATTGGRLHTIISDDDSAPEAPSVEVATVALDWRQSDKAIREAFDGWIARNRPRLVQMSGLNRDKPMARLGYLAVLRSVRLLAESDDFTASAALHRRWMAEVGNPLANAFRVREGWCRAIAEARKLQ